ncbi:hypothetical protein V496_05907, partial [Pseudogymnoascus sp. VKM F-4515 (FW-2607)]
MDPLLARHEVLISRPVNAAPR